MKKHLRKILLAFSLVASLGLAYGLFLYFLPHRDVQATATDYRLLASDLVTEYLSTPQAADTKYLDRSGDSRILEVTGPIHEVRTNLAGETIVVLRSPGSLAGVACTFTLSSSPPASALSLGELITVKGVIRAGTKFNDMLGIHTDVILEKCALL